MTVLYFAQAAAAAECRQEEWPGSAPLTLDAFWREAERRHPALAPLRPHCRVANGLAYLDPGDVIDPSRETAVLPPVSGG